MPDIIFHIGHQKTATTYLQDHIFPQVQALGHGSCVAGGRELSTQIRGTIAQYSGAIWATEAGQNLARNIERISRRDPVLYSSETFLRPPIWLQTSYVQPPQNYNFTAVDHLAAFAKHAWQDKGNVYAIVTIRHQGEWLASAYAEHSRHIDASQADFEQRIRAFLQRDDYTGWRFLDYNLLYQNLSAVLGPDKVCFLAMEDMKNPHYWQTLNAFVHADFPLPESDKDGRANIRRTSDNRWQLRSRRTRLHRKLVPKPGKGQDFAMRIESAIMKLFNKQYKHMITLPDDLRREVMDVYADSNRAIAKVMNRDLSAYGYY